MAKLLGALCAVFSTTLLEVSRGNFGLIRVFTRFLHQRRWYFFIIFYIFFWFVWYENIGDDLRVTREGRSILGAVVIVDE